MAEVREFKIKDKIVGYDLVAIAKFLIDFGFEKKDIKRLFELLLKVRKDIPSTEAEVAIYLKDNFSIEDAVKLRDTYGNDPELIRQELIARKLEDYSDLLSEFTFTILIGIADHADAVFELLEHFFPEVDEDEFYNNLSPEEMVSLIKRLLTEEEFMGFLKFI